MYRRDYRGVLVHERNEKMPPNKDGMKIVKMKKKKSGKVSKKESEDKPIIKEEELERWEDDGGPVGERDE